MTKDDLVKELRLLLGFAKIVTLDRGDAHWRVWTWLIAVTSDPERLAWTTRVDAYRALWDAGRVTLGQTVGGVRSDPLDRGLLHDFSTWQRANLFLIGPAGFSPERAEDILKPKRRRAIQTRGPSISTLSRGRVDPSQGRRHL